MYYTGVDPRTLQEVYVPKNPHEKAMQRALIQYRMPEHYDLVKEALLKAGRADLIGFDKKCLIPPRKFKAEHKMTRDDGGKQHRNNKKTTNAPVKKDNRRGFQNDRRSSGDNLPKNRRTRKKR